MACCQKGTGKNGNYSMIGDYTGDAIEILTPSTTSKKVSKNTPKATVMMHSTTGLRI